MHTLITAVVNNLNSNKKCLAVFLDLAKAFDTVPHGKLIQILHSQGIRGIPHEMFKNYLSERVQMVKINNTLSDKKTIRIGVPQGTVLGPILFILYINSLLKLRAQGLMVSYADDTAIVISGYSWESVKNKCITDLLRIKNWLQNHKLTLNLTKTTYIAFSLTRANRPLYKNIIIENHCIEETSHTKYLGIVIHAHLKWQPHIDYISKKIRGLVHKFYLLRIFLDRRTLIVVYQALVESILRYGILVWGGLYNNALYKLNIIQKYILKVIFNKNKLYPSQLLFNQNIRSIRSMYVSAVCVYIYQHPGLQSLIDHNYNTRIRLGRNMQVPISNNNLNLRYINYIGPKVYNLLPWEVRNCTNLRKFKVLIKEVIFVKWNLIEKLFA